MRSLYKRIAAVMVFILFALSNFWYATAAREEFIVRNSTLRFYNGTDTDVVIPNDMGITAIGMGAFSENEDLRSVVIPDGVEMIGDYAFADCGNLKSVNLPDGLLIIGRGAFSNCYGFSSGNALRLPKGLMSIGDGAFNYCMTLSEIYIPNSVTWIGASAFAQGKFPPPAIHGTLYSTAYDYVKEYNLDPPTQGRYTTAFYVEAQPGAVKLNIDGAVCEVAAYNIDGTNFVRPRDIASLFNGSEKQFNVVFERIQIDEYYYKTYLTLFPNTQYDFVGGELEPLHGTATISTLLRNTTDSDTGHIRLSDGSSLNDTVDFVLIDGNYYACLRDIAEVIDFAVEWDEDARVIRLDTEKWYSQA
jgi:hypothetical protein